ncbi:hypothetical protein ACS247_14365 [Musicola paradisiaca]|uniref:Uncharacterized protein n=1 Tax=Musicola paradisiaca (strain Ech703) TaxID=579405 RepID=C6C6M8_MUSP7|nr:conserved hypothetical protein [Musicola paradisiaca Ech703]
MGLKEAWGNVVKHKVVITSAALFQMVVAGLETYCIQHPHKQDIGVECFGRIWGQYQAGKKRSKFQVTSMTIDTSAKMHQNWALPRDDTEALKRAIGEVFRDELIYLGDFHTHPYTAQEVRSAKQIRKQTLYQFSDDDKERSLSCEPIEDTTLTLSIVLTLFRQQRENTARDDRIDDNTFEFSLGNIKCWLHAQVYNVDTGQAEETELRSDFLESFANIATPFYLTP